MLKLFSDLSDDFRATIETIKAEMVEMKMQVNLTLRAVGNQTSNQVCNVSSRLKIPEPKAFEVSGTNFEETKVMLASMHLSDDAKLWWRSKVNDVHNDRCTIGTWEDLKKEPVPLTRGKI
ncbi:uncharacterized protein E5676_scaffold45G00400 [Cucumis melo var. makuwa]|uniref:Uncharacterized protein n=1 Tax=Cucumis melo var. makuwa TaxID=1194695 RepID=A0A5D3CX38_CUCMM|nr:uncharacterized protein E5676_scaffold45G00400 [Cucumis melo var. makuwa]